MFQASTRRDFLRTAAAGAIAGVGASPAGARTSSEESTSGTLEVRVTDAGRKFAPATSLRWRSEPATGPDVVVLDPGRKFQEHLGIGGAFTDAACYMFHRLPAAHREELFHEMFHPSEMGLSAGRICIGSSDYSSEVYSYDEGTPDPELRRFSIEHDRSYILPILAQARAVNPDLFLLASPWSPPGWMKPNGSMLGGCMHQSSMSAYALYFLKFLQAYDAAGVHINAVTSQNEVDTEQDGRMPACAWPQEYEIGFITEHLGPLLQQHDVQTKIWILDHNYNLWGRVICCLDDRGVKRYANAVAWHGYVGSPEMVDRVRQAHPDTEMFWTEGGPDLTSKTYLTDWSEWGKTFTEILRHWCRSIIGWNLALDEHGRPNVGPFNCGGTVTIHSDTLEVTRSGHFWAMNHFSRSIRRGARRFDSQHGPAEVSHVAFEDPGGERILIFTNPGMARNVRVGMGNAVVDVDLSADSLTTLTWR